MNDILLSSGVIIYLLSEALLYLLLLVAALTTVSVLHRWNFDEFTPAQFRLEKRTYLVMSIIVFTLVLKILLLPYFVYTIEGLSPLVPGAMCAAGVIKANSYGNLLLVLKIVILFMGGLWLMLNRFDIEAKNYPYMKFKSWMFVLLFILLNVELSLDFLYFTHIETTQPVSCCSVIYGQLNAANTLPLGLDIQKLLILFYLLFLLLILSMTFGRALLRIVSALGFSVVSYYSVVYFFGTYIYELPTHRCPFCMLQKEYYFIGYVVWGMLLGGVFTAIQSGIAELFFKKRVDGLKKISLLFLSLFITLCSLYVTMYYFKNGVFL